METFAEVRNHIMERYELTIDEPFIISFEFPIDHSNRLQSIFLAELKTDHGRRVLRVELDEPIRGGNGRSRLLRAIISVGNIQLCLVRVLAERVAGLQHLVVLDCGLVIALGQGTGGLAIELAGAPVAGLFFFLLEHRGAAGQQAGQPKGEEKRGDGT